MVNWEYNTHKQWKRSHHRNRMIEEMNNAAQESYKTREKAQKDIKKLQAEIDGLQNKIQHTKQEVKKAKEVEDKLQKSCTSSRNQILTNKKDKSKNESLVYDLKLKTIEKGLPILNAKHFARFFKRYYRVQDFFIKQKKEVGGADHYQQAVLLHIKETSKDLLNKAKNDAIRTRQFHLSSEGCIDPLDYM